MQCSVHSAIGGYARPTRLRLNIVCLPYHLANVAREHARSNTYSNFGFYRHLSFTFTFEEIMCSIARSQLLTNMHVCDQHLLKGLIDEHEQRANGARASSMTACTDQSNTSNFALNKRAEHHWQRAYITANCICHPHTRGTTTETCECTHIPVTSYIIMQHRT